MASYARRPGAMRSLRMLLGLTCVLLVLLSGTVQVVHSHLGCPDPHANCSLCVAAHATVHLTEAQAPVAAEQVVRRVETLPPAQLESSVSAFPHFTRPPPALNLPV